MVTPTAAPNTMPTHPALRPMAGLLVLAVAEVWLEVPVGVLEEDPVPAEDPVTEGVDDEPDPEADPEGD